MDSTAPGSFYKDFRRFHIIIIEKMPINYCCKISGASHPAGRRRREGSHRLSASDGSQNHSPRDMLRGDPRLQQIPLAIILFKTLFIQTAGLHAVRSDLCPQARSL